MDMEMLLKAGMIVSIGAVGCIQIYFIYRYSLVSKVLHDMRNQSSGEHMRYKKHEKALDLKQP